ncbi:hypothetical protein ANRL2_00785 [Anaerolineae bacterium]|nr:hypothetical protein ANRL2_00785 [Anaerolineae bacterium]
MKRSGVLVERERGKNVEGRRYTRGRTAIGLRIMEHIIGDGQDTR